MNVALAVEPLKLPGLEPVIVFDFTPELGGVTAKVIVQVAPPARLALLPAKVYAMAPATGAVVAQPAPVQPADCVKLGVAATW